LLAGRFVDQPPEWAMEAKVMKSTQRLAPLCLRGLSALLLTGLLWASPGFAQSLPAEGDPFAGVSTVDGALMSAVSGQPGATGQPSAAGQENGSECGAACGTGSAVNLAKPVTEQVTYGNSTTVNVTAINNQSSSLGSVRIDTSGGFNIGGGGN